MALPEGTEEHPEAKGLSYSAIAVIKRACRAMDAQVVEGLDLLHLRNCSRRTAAEIGLWVAREHPRGELAGLIRTIREGKDPPISADPRLTGIAWCVVTLDGGKGKQATNSQRDRAILAQRQNGEPIGTIARRFGICESRAAQIVRRSRY
ncbi:MAG: hypothetical protein FD152_3196 [Xanthobacteraceae bacterium]|nr:MAG: hypothetical protein FD152_3196 [Xanthobacteraceae bacterium]